VTLPDYIAANLERPFAWGEFDCLLCAAGYVIPKTGIDYLAGQPKWTSAKEALRIVESRGGMEAILDTHFKRINPNFAQDGDLGLYEKSVGIFSGAHIVGPGPDGLIFIDRTKAKCAWSIF
jgi:hypothetical protein